MLCFFDSVGKFVGMYVEKTSFKKQTPHPFLLRFLIRSVHVLYSRCYRTRFGHKLNAHGLVRIARFVPCLLEPEIREREVLIQFGPERLLLIPRIQSGFSH